MHLRPTSKLGYLSFNPTLMKKSLMVTKDSLLFLYSKYLSRARIFAYSVCCTEKKSASNGTINDAKKITCYQEYFQVNPTDIGILKNLWSGGGHLEFLKNTKSSIFTNTL